MKLLVTGARGMLAGSVVPVLVARGHDVVPLSRAELDVCDVNAVDAALGAHRPDVVVHCAAFTAVDAAEREEETAFRVNATATGLVARACQRFGASLVLPSTDYVFSGTARRPYRPLDEPDPLNAYGRSKLAGERAALTSAERALVVRTSWLYGRGGRNFVDTVTRLARERGEIEVVSDQWGRPTWTACLARATARLIEHRVYGIVHATAAGEPASWYEVACLTLRLGRVAAAVRPVASSDFAAAAARPAYSVLDCSETEALIGPVLQDWKRALAQYIHERDAHDSVE